MRDYLSISSRMAEIKETKKKNMVQKVTCTPMFIAALFTIAKTWKQPKCPSTEEWIKMKAEMNELEGKEKIINKPEVILENNHTS